MKSILVIHGPNLNLLGEREPDVYGRLTLHDIDKAIVAMATKMAVDVRNFQSNHEGQIIDFLHQHRTWADGIVINPGAYTHYSYAIRDAIAAVNLPTVEVHLSDISKREAFRQVSVIKPVCIRQIAGLGYKGYLQGIEYLKAMAALETIESFIGGGLKLDQVLKKSVDILKKSNPKYSWVGIYLVDDNQLLLHNFLGRPTPHSRIEMASGICGAAATAGRSIIVPDVNSDTRYLACSVEAKSEIVVPILKAQRVLGEIDIDSDELNAFHDGDKEVLEACAVVLSDFFQ
jgi:3-dehydroquinate dehydratase-2